MAGLSRAGSLSAPRFGLPLRVAGAPCRLAVAAASAALFKSCSILAIKPCSGARLPGQCDGARTFNFHILFDRTLLALPFIDKGGETGLVIPELVAVYRKAVPLRRDGLAKRNQFAEVASQFFVLVPVTRAPRIRAAWRYEAIAARLPA